MTARFNPHVVLFALGGGTALLLFGALVWWMAAGREGPRRDVELPPNVAKRDPGTPPAPPAPIEPEEKLSRTADPPAPRQTDHEEDGTVDQVPIAEEAAIEMTDNEEPAPPEDDARAAMNDSEAQEDRPPKEDHSPKEDRSLPEATKRKPVPGSSDQQDIRKLLDETFETASARTPEERLALANKLAALAEKAEDTKERFVLLRRASELASNGGDAGRMLELVERIAEEFDVDRLLAQCVMLDGFAKKATGEDEIGALVDGAANVIDEALVAERFDLADSLSASVHRVCQSSAGRAFRVEALARRRKVQELCKSWQEVQAARTVLDSNPADEAAQTVLAQWYCFVRGDWGRAMPHFAKGSDPGLRPLARRELEDVPIDAAGRVDLADAWWKLAEVSDASAKQHVQGRAAHWYRLAQPELTGLQRQRVDKRLKELAEVAQPAEGAPAAEAPSTSGFASRSDPNRARLLAKTGGSAASEASVALALEWFARHQLPDGGWSFDHTLAPSCRGQCRNPGSLRDTRNAATAMALLPFLGAGQTHRAGKHQEIVRAGIQYLIRSMRLSSQGGSYLENGGTMYSHGLATIALTEAYGITKDRTLFRPAQAAVNFICSAQDPAGGGWRYQPRQAGDTSVTGWQIMALKSAHMSQLQVPPEVIKKASRFLDSVQANRGANYGYTGPGSGPATTAIGVLGRMYFGWEKDNPALQLGVEWISDRGVSTGGAMYYNYYATQVVRHWEGEAWEKWNDQMRDWLVDSQAKQGHEEGSWYFAGDSHGDRGGRHYMTSLATLMLQAYYRYPSIFDPEDSK